jgi:hypothetical protein
MEKRPRRGGHHRNSVRKRKYQDANHAANKSDGDEAAFNNTDNNNMPALFTLLIYTFLVRVLPLKRKVTQVILGRILMRERDF